eukprot:comp6554_c0_seq1/m.2325 comp6554_c0_seq1/g.2325  ORF comp6554_c0_seq1/g.2325 comp6554_c0_seq1/m.2325 type:complete len:456 (-) comp6554_c0_seq1:204-1571(-)
MAKLWAKVLRIVSRYRKRPNSHTTPRTLKRAWAAGGEQATLPLQLADARPIFPPLRCDGELPSPRSGHVSVCDEEGTYLYVFGGYHDGRCFNDLYRLHLATQAWEKLNCTGRTPSNRVSHSALIVGGLLYVFGGSDVPFGQANNNELFVCDLARLHWSLVNTTGDCPTPRYGHTLVYHKQHLYLFGGTSGCHYFNDFYRLDLRTNIWTLLPDLGESTSELTPAPAASGLGAAANTSGPLNFLPQSESESEVLASLLSQPPTHVHFGRPTPRYRHEAVADNECMYVFGGGVPNTIRAPIDVYVYHFETNTWAWRRCEPSGPKGQGEYPVARRSHSSVIYDGKVYMFGGTDGIHMFDDFWCLDLRKFQWQRLELGRRTASGKCFHTAAIAPQGRMYMFGGCEDSCGNVRSNEVSICYLKMPTLQDMCLRVIGQSRLYSYNQLRNVGVPEHVISPFAL